MHKKFENLISVEEAKSLIRKNLVLPVAGESIMIEDSIGRVLLSDIIAAGDSPYLPRSAMDGYAVRAEDITGTSEENAVKLKIAGRIEIGEKTPEISGTHICAKIPTGGSVPEYFDTVVPIEHIRENGDSIQILKFFKKGSNIDPKGSDYAKGEILVHRGQIIRSKDISVIASAGIKSLEVLKKIRVGIAPTGNELIPRDSELIPGKVYESNGWGIKAALEETRLFDAQHYGILSDNLDNISDTIGKMAGENDLVITTGGTSAGDHDYVYRAIEKTEPGIIFHGMKSKPGKPTLFAVVDHTPVICLPGPPVAAMMLLYEIFIPILYEKTSLKGIPVRMRAKLGKTTKISKNRLNLIPVSLKDEGTLTATPIHGGSGAMTRLSNAQAYITVYGNVDFLEAGTEVEVIPFSVMPL